MDLDNTDIYQQGNHLICHIEIIIEYFYVIEGGYNEVIELFILKKIISLTCKIYILLPNKTFLKETIRI